MENSVIIYIIIYPYIDSNPFDFYLRNTNEDIYETERFMFLYWKFIT